MDERQMSFFEEGGMTAPEVEVDPESGNEVPPGSLPEEVRDDVDAQLSGGEYVVPADVLRYYGMKFFEDLRKQAKEELGQMDSEGRIGGEPSMEEGSDLSPEEMAMLQEVMSQGEPQFNQGGLLRNPELYGQPAYNEGGLQPVQQFNPDQWRDVGSSYFGNQGGQEGISVGSYYKTYVGPNGETQLILFVDGKPTTPIPDGFKPREEMVDKEVEDQAKEDVIDEDWWDRQKEQEKVDSKSWAEENYETINENPVGFGLSSLEKGFGSKLTSTGGRIGMAVAGPLGAVLGAAPGTASELGNLADARAAEIIAGERGLDTAELREKIEEYEKNLSRPASALDKLGFATGEQKANKYMELADSLLGTSSQTDLVFKSSRGDYSDRTSEETATKLKNLTENDDRFAGQKVTTKENTLTGGTTSSVTSKDGNIEVNRNDKTTIDPSQKERTRPNARPQARAKGGLISRPKKKKNTTKT